MAAIALSALAAPACADPIDTGASLRLRWESADAAFFGSAGPPVDAVLLTRALAHVDAAQKSGLRGFVQIGWHDQFGRAVALPTDENQIDVHQAWLEAPIGDASLRIGRQELALGSARLVGVRESPNIRRAFDGAVLEWRNQTWRVRALALTTVDIDPDAFDVSGGAALSGIYATRTARTEGRSSVDLYVLRLRRDSVRFAAAVGEEDRWTIGLRVFGRIGAIDYNFEPMIQSGDTAGKTIRAWTIASDTGWTFAGAPLQPRLSLKANLTSGDQDARDSRLETFDPLFPNLAYFSEAATLAPQNHIDLQPELALSVSPTLTVRASANWFWRAETSDAVYRAGGAALPGTAGSSGRLTAHQAELELQWRASETLEVRASLLNWRPADMLRLRGAEEGLFAVASIGLQF